MESGRANAINVPFLDSLDRLTGEALSRGARALVMTGYDRFFSAGLDLPTLFPLERPLVEDLILRFHRVFARLFSLPIPVVAAVNGHAIAGGCVLAMQADVRIMAAGDAKIGLNEVALGVGLPILVVETCRLQLPPATFTAMALEGILFAPEEAHRLGVVHEIASPQDLLPRALAKAQSLCRAPAPALAQVKASLRRPVVEAMDSAFEVDARRWLDVWFDGETRRRVAEAVQRLAAKGK